MKIVLKKIGVLLFSGFLYAGPPMMTDDPFAPDVGKFEINFASEVENSDDLTVVVPIVDINYGIFPNTQLTIETAYVSSDNKYKSDGLKVAIKYNFYRSDTLNIALYPKYLFYPISTPFNEGESYELQIPIDLKLSDNLKWVTSLSYLYPQKAKNHYEVGTYLAYEKNNHTYYLETFVEEMPINSSMATIFNVGYFYQYKDNLGFMGSIGSEMVDYKKEADVAYLGFQVIF